MSIKTKILEWVWSSKSLDTLLPKYEEIQKSYTDVDKELDQLAKEFYIERCNFNNRMKDDDNEVIKGRIQEKYDIFLSEHRSNIKSAKGRFDKVRGEKAAIEKAIGNHKYIRKEPDGKGGWNYVYKELNESDFESEEDYKEFANKRDDKLQEDLQKYYLGEGYYKGGGSAASKKYISIGDFQLRISNHSASPKYKSKFDVSVVTHEFDPTSHKFVTENLKVNQLSKDEAIKKIDNKIKESLYFSSKEKEIGNSGDLGEYLQGIEDIEKILTLSDVEKNKLLSILNDKNIKIDSSEKEKTEDILDDFSYLLPKDFTPKIKYFTPKKEEKTLSQNKLTKDDIKIGDELSHIKPDVKQKYKVEGFKDDGQIIYTDKNGYKKKQFISNLTKSIDNDIEQPVYEFSGKIDIEEILNQDQIEKANILGKNGEDVLNIISEALKNKKEKKTKQTKYADFILFNQMGEILLLKRSQWEDDHQEAWVIPGGHVDEGEAFLHAAHRELHEESGIWVTPEDCKKIGEYKDSKTHIQYFTARVNSEEKLPILQLTESSDYRWVPLYDIPEYPMVFNMQRNIMKILGISPVKEVTNIKKAEIREKYGDSIADYIEGITKSMNHKYISKKPDGKGGWDYKYEETKGEINILEKINEKSFHLKNTYKEGIELVPISEIEKFKEFDREVQLKWGEGDSSLQELEKQIIEEGIKNPITLEVRDNKGLITEGNTRLAVAKRLGLKYIPVKINSSSRSWKGTVYENKAIDIDKGNIAYNLSKQKDRYPNNPVFDTPLEFGFSSIDPKHFNKSIDNSIEKSISEISNEDILQKAYLNGIIDESVIEKAWKTHPIGTVTTRSDGTKWKKVSETGNTKQDWQPVKGGKNPKQDETSDSKPLKGDEGENPKLSDKELKEAAKTSSETALASAVKESKDPEVRQTAHEELDRRQKEEKPREEGKDKWAEKNKKLMERRDPEGIEGKKKDKKLNLETKEGIEAEIKRLRAIDTDDLDEISKISDDIQGLLKKRKEVGDKVSSERKVSFEEYRKGFKSFDSKDRKRIHDYYQEQSKSLNFDDLDELAAADYYKDDGYEDYRSFLTDENDFQSQLNLDEESDPNDIDLFNYIKDSSNYLSSFISKNKIKEDLSLNRRVKGEGVKFFKSLKEGDIYEDKSFSSTSLDELEGFGDFNIEVLAKKGSSVSNLANDSEKEYLIDKGSKFRVLKINDTGIIVELL